MNSSKLLSKGLLSLVLAIIWGMACDNVAEAQGLDSLDFYWEVTVGDTSMIPFYIEYRNYISAGDEFYIAMGVKPPTDTTISELQNWVQSLRQVFPQNKIVASTSGLLNLDSLGRKISRNAYLDSNVYCLSYDYEPGFEPEFSWNLDSTLMALDSARQIAHEYGKQLMTAIIARSLLADWNPPGTDFNPTGELWNYDSIRTNVDILEVQTQGFAHWGLTHNEGLSIYDEALDTLLSQLHGAAFVPQLTFGTTSNGISAQNVYDAVNETYKRGIRKVVLWQVAGAEEYMQEFFCLTGVRAPILIAGIRNQRNSAPETFRLLQNYPNPFNPSTTVRFSVDTKTFAKLVVYNSLGERVAELFDGEAKPGQTYEIMFTAISLSSGVYLARLQTSEGSRVQKMMLLK